MSDTSPRGDNGTAWRRGLGRTVLRLDYPGLAHAVVLDDAPDVMAGLLSAISGWSPTVTEVNDGTPEPKAGITVVRGNNGGFTLTSAWLDEPLRNLPTASAVCAVIADLSQSFFEERPGSLALHCGAFVLDGRLIAMTGNARAGKSTLMARLTAEKDIRVLCDDVLPVLPDGMACGLGAAPRLRLPLPQASSTLFRDHVAAHTGLSDDKYAYVTAPTVAPFGARWPLSVLVVLSRRADGPARLHHIEPTAVADHLLRQNMADPGEGRDSFDRIADLANSLCCMTLVYSDLEDAVALIRRAFAGAGAGSSDDSSEGSGERTSDRIDPGVTIHAPLPSEDDRDVETRSHPVPLGSRWKRSPAVAVRRLGEAMVLWRPDTRTWFRLNPVASAVWTLLEDPNSGATIVAILAEAFPDQDQNRIATDISALLGALAAEELIVPD